MECPNCHAQNRSGAKFCQTCGTTLISNTQSLSSHTEINQQQKSNLPVTAPLSTRVENFNPLPPGALLDHGRYVIRKIHSTSEKINTYLVDDLITVRQCTNCGHLESSNNAQVCVVCGTNLYNAQPVTLRYIAEEKLYDQSFDAEQQLMEMNIQHSGLNLPHAIFIEKPYTENRYYRVTPEHSPITASSLTELQEIPIILAWGIRLAEALDILHSQFITPSRISLDDIYIENNLATLANINTAKSISETSRSSARKIFQANVCDLAEALWYMATGKAEISKMPEIPDDIYALFAKAKKGSISAKVYAEELHKKLDELRRPESATLIIGRSTDVGMLRTLNEDSLLTLDYSAVYHSKSVPVGVFVVADGMGGHAAGDVASRLTCQVLAKRIANDIITPAAEGKLPTQEAIWLTNAISDANQVVFDQRNIANSDMGNTLVAALLVGNSATIANVGDSRCYHLSEQGIKQITTDHSLVERLVGTGQITREEAAIHPQKNVIYRVIGDRQKVDVDIFEQSLNLGEALLLCSDGLNGMVQDSQIFNIWQSAKSPQEVCIRLVDEANKAGGEDNITVIIVQLMP